MIINKSHIVLRNVKNNAFTVFAWLAIVIAIVVFASILWCLIERGLPALFRLKTFLEVTPPPNGIGGLSNGLMGSLIMTGLAIVISAPIGILIATYLAE